MTEIIINEPFRAIFYAPYYLAEAYGAFERQGLNVRINTVGDLAKSGSGVLKGEADLAWSGPLRPLTDQSRDPNALLRSFCAVVMRDPFVLVGKGANPSFKLTDLSSLRLGVVSEVTTPTWCLKLDMMRAGLEVPSLNILQGPSMAENTDAVLRGDLDVALVFEPYASQVEAAGGSVWYAGARRGLVAYSAFYATKTRISQRREEMVAVVRAMSETLQWIAYTSATELTDKLKRYFHEVPGAILFESVHRYKRLQIWSETTVLPEEALNRLADAALFAGAITHNPGYAACIDPSLAEQVQRGN